jgi:ELWxxDGT repeat protein
MVLLAPTSTSAAIALAAGTEFWRYNSSGAALFKDLLPARWDASDPGSFRGPWALIAAGSSLFFQSEVIRSFIGSDGDLEEDIENQLWHSDGTPEGTQPLGLALTRFGVAQLRSQFAVGNKLFFSAWNDTFTDLNLWTSDGTPAGTQPLATLPSHMATVAKAGNRLFFVAGDALNGNELWTSDGTSAGTHMVKDIIPGPSSPGIELGNGTGWGRVQSAALGNTLYFSADDGSSGRELWKSDGSAAGTVLVADLNPDLGSSYISWPTLVDSTLFFSAYTVSSGYELWGLDVGEALLTPIESQGNTSLLRRHDGLASVRVGADLTPITSPFGLGPGDGQSAWQMLAAERVNGQNQILWRNNPGQFLHLWNLDLNWNWQSSYGTIALASSAAADLEASFEVDVDGDGFRTGPTTIQRVNLGSTNLGYALQSGSGAPIQITYPGGHASASNPGNGWIAVAGGASGSGYAFYWRNSGTGQTARWDLNSAATYQSGALLSPSQLIAEEVAIHADLNADGIIGTGSTTIENQGNASLLRQSDGLAAVQVGGRIYAVSSPFGLGTGDASSEWQMLAAEAVGLQNQILWRNNPGNFLHLWNLDASWSWQSSSGNFAPSSAAALGLETSFQLDLNGNGVIG